MSTVIDAHVHLWDPSRGDYGWLRPELTGLYRHIDVSELRTVTSGSGVDGVVLVQAAPTVAESDYLLSIAERASWILGVVGWLDFDDDRVEEAVAKRAAREKFVGVRPMLQDLSDADWILAPNRGRALRALESNGLTFDALIRPIHLSRMETVAQRFPALSLVIDHAAKAAIGESCDYSWLSGLRSLAANENVVCKLSGLLTELIPGTSEDKVIERSLQILDLFGCSRVLWGSDWPVLTEAAAYDRWMMLTHRILGSMSASERAAVMGENAARIYKLHPRIASALILLHPDDNVLVCRRAVSIGEGALIGAGERLEILHDVELGHKVARRKLAAGEKVIKYGAPIGSMTSPVPAGGWIHLHNMQSDYISAHTRAGNV